MKLFCRQSGNGPPMVILHGLFGISDNWVSIARELGEQYTVYVPDLRNHGQSPHSDVLNFSALEDDLLELTEEYSLGEIVLMGHSLGGKTAMHFALHHPEKIKKLIIVDIGLRKTPADMEHQMLINAMLNVDLSKARARSDVDRQLETTVHSVRLRQFLLKNVYWRNKHALDWRLNLPAINDNLLNMLEGVDIPGQYTGPVLFIRGGRSDYIRDEDLGELKNKFPGLLVKTIPEAGHWVHADSPGEFLQAVRAFLDQ
ncbi:MAG: alpha/beta fold hydrolase [Bacteroidetes bacterium]|nr:alpha/beta fold hydrolase [Bacteroidota bacterium]